MVLIKILKRKDAASVLLAIVLAMIVITPIGQMTAKPAGIISGLSGNQYFGYGPPGGWQSQYLYPVLWVLVQIVALELVCWAVILLMWLVKKVPLLTKLV